MFYKIPKMGLKFTAALVVVSFVGGLCVGYFAIPTSKSDAENNNNKENGKQILDKKLTNKDSDFIKTAINNVKLDSITEYLRELSKSPHLAGTKRDYELTDYVHDKFVDFGFDHVEKVPYDVLLSYPNSEKPNKLYILDQQGKVNFTSLYKEKIYRPEDDDPTFVISFNGYSPNGSFTGPIVYVNYATVEDFEVLRQNEVNVTGAICLARYGKIFRGNKMHNAYENGAKGLLIYDDPQDVALYGTNEKDVYPNSEWLPSSGMQRGTVFYSNGDPVTPFGPSIDGAYRIDQSEAKLPKILTQPLAYEDAFYIINMLQGPIINHEDWNNTYHVGPGFKEEYQHLSPTLEINNELKTVTLYDVIGRLYGSVEPDRYVLHGNHLDAWGFGALDPSSGTSALLEVGRVLGDLKSKGWRPRRTIILCSWAAEEYGLIGSQEWVEEHTNSLMTRAVAYLNVDTCASGPAPVMSASPLLAQALVDSSKIVPSPFNGSSLYEYWKMGYNNISDLDRVSNIGSGSDMASLSYYAGIPVTDIAFTIDYRKYDIKNIYPTYHTAYETIFLAEKFVDPDYHIQRACSQFALSLMLNLTESQVLPLKPVLLANAIQEAFKEINSGKIKDQLNKFGINTEYVNREVINFVNVAKNFEESIKSVNEQDVLEVRRINDQLMFLERNLILPTALPDNPINRHVVFAASMYDGYASGGFPGITDLLYRLSRCTDSAEDRCVKLINVLKRHVSDIRLLIRQASESLLPTTTLTANIARSVGTVS